MTFDEIKSDFELLENWEERYRYLIDLGKRLAPFNPADKNDRTKVEGCMSQVWMVGRPVTVNGETVLALSADSDAAIVRGLIGVLLALYDRQTPAEILGLDVTTLFDDLGFAQHISMNRRSGFYAMIQRIKHEASLLEPGHAVG